LLLLTVLNLRLSSPDPFLERHSLFLSG
jgi:hypothetical protein